MVDKNETSVVSDSIEDTNLQSTSILPQRRRWVAGVGAVLLSVKTGSALAGGVCASPSGFKSIDANPKTSHRPQNFDGSCHSHGWYNGHPEKMGQYRRPLNTLQFHGLLPAPSGMSNTTTLLQVVTSGGSYADARDLVTVFLDFKLGYQTILNVTDVKDMWVICYGSGSVLTTSRFYGWNATDVRNYLDVYVGNRSWPPPAI